MSYAIFRVQPINKLKDLGQIGAHNTRTKEAYKSNPDIDKNKSIEKNYFHQMKIVIKFLPQNLIVATLLQFLRLHMFL